MSTYGFSKWEITEELMKIIEEQEIRKYEPSNLAYLLKIQEERNWFDANDLKPKNQG